MRLHQQLQSNGVATLEMKDVGQYVGATPSCMKFPE